MYTPIYLPRYYLCGNKHCLPAMPRSISIDLWQKELSELTVVDVRSPAEFRRGHISEAVNIPVLSDEQRSIVGAAYQNVTVDDAIRLGYEFVHSRLSGLVSHALEVAPEKELIVYCWRGGMRSSAFATLLESNGFHKVYIFQNGYKAYRKHVLSFFEQPFKLRVLGGYTGSGKTEILQCLAGKGQQIVDLERLANHRGSAFGGIAMPPQPTTEQFQNDLYYVLKKLDITKPIWIEDESSTIGRIFIPTPLFARINQQPLFFIDITADIRAKYLVNTYASLNQDELAESIQKISKRLGLEQANHALLELQKKNYFCVVQILLSYYDKYYLRSIHRTGRSNTLKVKMNTMDHIENAICLIHLAEKLIL